MRDHDRALDELAVAELDEHLRHGLLRRDVERRGELVRDQERRVEERGEHHHHPLLHPAGELDRVAVEHGVVEPDERQSPAELRERLVVGDAAGMEQFRDHPPDLANRVEGAHRVLRNDRDLAVAERVHRLVVGERQLLAVEVHRPLDHAHPPVEPDQALAQRGLATARLAREAHDLAVGDREGDPVEGANVAAEGAVVDAEVVDREAHVRRSLGLKTSSRPTFIT